MYKAKVKYSVGPLKDVSNKIIDNDLEMCNIFNLLFLSVFTNENINQMPDIDQNFNGSDEDLLNTIQVSCDEVTKEIDRLKPNKSSSPGEVFARVLKECKEELSQPLTQLFNQSLNEGVVPESLKTAIVVPIFLEGRQIYCIKLPSNKFNITCRKIS